MVPIRKKKTIASSDSLEVSCQERDIKSLVGDVKTGGMVGDFGVAGVKENEILRLEIELRKTLWLAR